MSAVQRPWVGVSTDLQKSDRADHLHRRIRRAADRGGQAGHPPMNLRRTAVPGNRRRGRRNVGVGRRRRESAAQGCALNADRVIPVSAISGSFDITSLFNGLRPLPPGADPAVFNTFAQNMIDLLQGEGGVGIGDVLGDVES